MIREHWRDPRFWRWFWHNRAPSGVKLVVVMFAAVGFLVGGYVAADRLSTASAGVSAVTYETTIEQPVTVREHGKTIVRRVAVVRRVVLRPQTAFETRYDTRLITTPGGVKVVRQKVVRYVPVIRRRVVTVNGKTRTIKETHLVAVTTIRTETQTETSVITNERTVINAQTVVNQNTVTQVSTQNVNVTVPVTVSETHTQTLVTTQTLPAETVTETLPGETVTETVTVTTTP